MHLGLIFVFFYDAKHQSLPLSACLLALSGSLLVACGFWITLQFQWIQYQNPGVVEAMESALFCLLPVVCPVIQTWAVSTLTGIAALPYFLLISMMAPVRGSAKCPTRAMHSFSKEFNVLPPWNYAGVSLALFSLVAAMLDLCTLSPDEQFTKRGRTAVYLLVGVIAVSLSIGVPWFLLPAPILAAIALPSYLCKRSLTAFLAVILGVMVTIVWFLYYHFWSLDIYYGDITSQSMCLAVAVNVLAALVVAHCISEKGLSYLREWIAVGYLTFFVLYEVGPSTTCSGKY
eukprot:scaffold762_cov363-Pavlova_lutheri.AAC.78